MRICFLLKVRQERVEEYKIRHAEVWPEMLTALRETGWRNYSLFLRPDGLLVGYLEAEDFDKCCAAMKRPAGHIPQNTSRDRSSGSRREPRLAATRR